MLIILIVPSTHNGFVWFTLAKKVRNVVARATELGTRGVRYNALLISTSYNIGEHENQ